jgi:hypothetical protein
MANKFLSFLEKVGKDLVKYTPEGEAVANDVAAFIPGALPILTTVENVLAPIVKNITAAQVAQAANPNMTSAQQGSMAVSLSADSVVEEFSALGYPLSAAEQAQIAKLVADANTALVGILNFPTSTTLAAKPS